MQTSEIPLSPNNQTFGVTLGTVDYRFTIQWRGIAWILDIDALDQTPLIHGVPMLPGGDLLAQYATVGIPAQLVVLTDSGDEPAYAGLGTTTRLYAVTA